MSERGGKVTVARCFLGGSSNVQFIVNTLGESGAYFCGKNV